MNTVINSYTKKALSIVLTLCLSCWGVSFQGISAAYAEEPEATIPDATESTSSLSSAASLDGYSTFKDLEAYLDDESTNTPLKAAHT